MAIWKVLHVLSAIIWVGGMFFAYVVLRPAAVEVLEPPQRLSLWGNVFRRFFVWVWGTVAMLLASGGYLVFLYGGMGQVRPYVHLMLATGLTMIAIYSYVYFRCYRPYRGHIARQHWKEAGEILVKIRKLIALNLTLGVLTVCIAVFGMAGG